MKKFFHTTVRPLAGRILRPPLPQALCLAALAIWALAEWGLAGAARQTFVFYPPGGGNGRVEERMIRRAPSREAAIRRYVEETLLGPVSPELAPLFPRETALRSLLFRKGIVYADLSLTAAEGGGSLRGLQALHAGIRRNFRYVQDVRLFIQGERANYAQFQNNFAMNFKKKNKSD